MLATKVEELKGALEAKESERIVIEQLLQKKIMDEEAAYEKAGLEVAVLKLDQDVEVAEEPQPSVPLAKHAESEYLLKNIEAPADSSTAAAIAEQKAEIERLRLEKAKAEAELQAAAAEAARIKAESERLKVARLEAAAEVLRTESQADAETEEQPATATAESGHTQEKHSGRKNAAAKAELNVSVASVGAWKRAAMMATEPIDYGGTPVTAGSEPFAFLGEGVGNPGLFFGDEASASGSGSVFTFDPSMEHIEFSSDEEIIEIQEASNLARVALEGNPTQNCRGFICTLGKGNTAHVHVAIVLTENNRVLVYSPDKQPESADAWNGVTADGVQFMELIGFMMATVKLGTDKASRTAAIKKIPVLHQIMAES